MQEKKKQKVKTTILIDKTLKKFAKMYAIQNDMSLCELVEKALEEKLVSK
jgi:hypothetical protein